MVLFPAPILHDAIENDATRNAKRPLVHRQSSLSTLDSRETDILSPERKSPPGESKETEPCGWPRIAVPSADDFESGVPDLAQFNALVDRFAGRVYNHALRMLGNREDAEEATQDVFLRVYRSLDAFRGASELSTWLYRITVNVCLSRRRRRRPGMVDVSGMTDEIIDQSPGPDDLLAREEDKKRIGAMIARLPRREAAAVTLYYIDGLDYATISRLLNIPPGSVATALHRGRERLAHMLRAEKKGPSP
jgi:RNA polymerase sigma-70 factor (ECF subfamily)